MLRRCLWILLLALVMSVPGFYLGRSTSVYAQGQGASYAIPRAWGTLKASTADNFYFEDAQGTVRLVQVEGYARPPRVLVTLTRQ